MSHVTVSHSMTPPVKANDENVAAVNMPTPTSGAFKHVCE